MKKNENYKNNLIEKNINKGDWNYENFKIQRIYVDIEENKKSIKQKEKKNYQEQIEKKLNEQFYIRDEEQKKIEVNKISEQGQEHQIKQNQQLKIQ